MKKPPDDRVHLLLVVADARLELDRDPLEHDAALAPPSSGSRSGGRRGRTSAARPPRRRSRRRAPARRRAAVRPARRPNGASRGRAGTCVGRASSRATPVVVSRFRCLRTRVIGRSSSSASSVAERDRAAPARPRSRAARGRPARAGCRRESPPCRFLSLPCSDGAHRPAASHARPADRHRPASLVPGRPRRSGSATGSRRPSASSSSASTLWLGQGASHRSRPLRGEVPRGASRARRRRSSTRRRAPPGVLLHKAIEVEVGSRDRARRARESPRWRPIGWSSARSGSPSTGAA